ncbi:hypothetical protein [Anaerofustis stercorihominis]|uniref:hypothetical protein n=1 Tax=Anaerofustis stercorihominis TaxID=214853 RepID=UPI003990EF56
MAINMITGYIGEPHVTSAQAGISHAGMYGTDRYVLDVLEGLEYELISNNLIRIKSGMVLNQGRFMGIDHNDYVDIEIDNGQNNKKRCDLIVCTYTKNVENGIESAELKNIKGISGDDYIMPEYTKGNIINNETVDEFPLYKININGLVIESIDKLFQLSSNFSKIDSNVINLTSAISGIEENINNINNHISILESEQKILWSGGSYMGDGVVVGFSEKINEQKNGIVLIWSEYDSEPQNSGFHYFYIPKKNYEGNQQSGHSIDMFLSNATFSTPAGKRLLITNTALTGSVLNTSTGTSVSGIKYYNNKYVLRAVLGV